MPYEVAFEKSFDVPDAEGYFNECCWGGDVVSDRLHPSIARQYEKVQANQEDWAGNSRPFAIWL